VLVYTFTPPIDKPLMLLYNGIVKEVDPTQFHPLELPPDLPMEQAFLDEAAQAAKDYTVATKAVLRSLRQFDDSLAHEGSYEAAAATRQCLRKHKLPLLMSTGAAIVAMSVLWFGSKSGVDAADQGASAGNAASATASSTPETSAGIATSVATEPPQTSYATAPLSVPSTATIDIRFRSYTCSQLQGGEPCTAEKQQFFNQHTEQLARYRNNMTAAGILLGVAAYERVNAALDACLLLEDGSSLSDIADVLQKEFSQLSDSSALLLGRSMVSDVCPAP